MAPVERQERRIPLRAEDWVRAALDAATEGGTAAIGIEALAERLGATKGSFYWHFPSRDALVTAALEEWERGETEQVIERFALVRDPVERLRALALGAFLDRTGGLRDAALSASTADPIVGPIVRRVTRRRVEYLTHTFAELGWPPDGARHRALLVYSAYIGLFHHLRADPDRALDDDELRDYTDALVAALVHPYPGADGSRPAGPAS